MKNINLKFNTEKIVPLLKKYLYLAIFCIISIVLLYSALLVFINIKPINIDESKILENEVTINEEEYNSIIKTDNTKKKDNSEGISQILYPF